MAEKAAKWSLPAASRAEPQPTTNKPSGRGGRPLWLQRLPRLLLVGIPFVCCQLALTHWVLSRSPAPPKARLVSYHGELISWEPCGEITGHPLECSSIDVPMDQFNATNSANKTFSLPLIRLRGKQATQNLLLNPGGPGGSGIEFVFRRGEQLNAIVGEGFHLVSFDPRAVNSSRPQASCYPDRETRRDLSAVRTSRLAEDSAEVYAWSHNFVRACADTMGEHAAYVNTPQTAADMNTILDALGQPHMAYWGFSYGTLLGQTYATLFPDRARRVIIDGVVNQFDWYEGRFNLESFADTDHVLRGFLSECVKAGPANCSLAAESDSPAVLWGRLLALADQLREDPLSVYVNNSVYGLLDHEKLWYNGVFPALYKPQAWHALADRLARLLRGNATDAFLAYARDDPWNMAGDANEFVSLSDGLSGPKYWPQDRRWLLDQLLPLFNQTLFTAVSLPRYYTRQQWLVPRTHAYQPRRGVHTAHPLLILSTTYDPVCPLVSARSARAAFEGSQIVEVKGYGHCSVAVSSMCLARHVRAFLYDGKLPDAHAQCEVDGPYFLRPEEDGDGKVVAQRHFEDPEERRIHLAQLELARDWDWPRPR